MPYSNRRPSLRERASARNATRRSNSASKQSRPKILKEEQLSARQRTDFKGNIRRGIFIGIGLIIVVLILEMVLG